MAGQVKQIFIEPSSKYPDSNIKSQYEIQKAGWVWHPDCMGRGQNNVVLFRCQFQLDAPEQIRIHVSADNRYELFLDQNLISRGPHRCDEYHWSFSSHEIFLEKGSHEFYAMCYWLNEEAPEAQHTIGHGGFIFAAEGKLGEKLNTSLGKWEVAKWEGWGYEPNPLRKSHYCAVGHQFVMDGAMLSADKNWVTPIVLMKPLKDHSTGLIRSKWKLYPTPLPELMYQPRNIGILRGVASTNYKATEIVSSSPLISNWQNLIHKKTAIKIPENSRHKWVIDLENYYCGFPQIKLSAGKDSVVKILWAESLYIENDKIRDKENRNEIQNKIFYGFGDTIKQHGQTAIYKPLWWRCGRYLLIDIETKNEALNMEEFSIIESRYPYEMEGKFSCSDAKLDQLIPLMVRGLQSCSHESFMDCPYYEQLMYVGDTRIEMLVNHVMSKDSRLTKRCIELFDWSRYSTGYVMERYPSHEQQLSLTFSLIWPLLLKDFALWRNDKRWVQARLVGMRCMMENMRIYRNQQGLLENLPGWSFLDWVPNWQLGMHPDLETAPSSIINLFYVLALQSGAELENEFGDAILAKRNQEAAKEVSKSIKKLFWDSSRSLFADNPNKTSYSEHAQSLAILADILEGTDKDKCVQSLLKDTDLCRATVYFSHYLFEALVKIGKGYLIEEKLNFWKNMEEIGLKTPLEHPEPTRSDCHAWGSHPLYHYYASLAGIRPANFGFTKVIINPQPGNLSFIDCVLPHTLGEIKVNLKFANGQATGNVDLPNGLSGTFTFANQKLTLNSGLTKI
jgi:alpha-L-rhamnosidase